MTKVCGCGLRYIDTGEHLCFFCQTDVHRRQQMVQGTFDDWRVNAARNERRAREKYGWSDEKHKAAQRRYYYSHLEQERARNARRVR